MDFYSIGLAVVVGAFAGLIAVGVSTLFRKEGKARKVVMVLAFVVLFVGLKSLGTAYVLPVIKAFAGENVEQRVTEALESVPAYIVIRDHDPEVYKALHGKFVSMLRAGKKKEEVTAQLQAIMSNLVITRLPHASDQALVEYVRMMVVKMEALADKGGGLCYRFLYPQVEGGINATEHFPKQIISDDLEALANVLKSSVNQKRSIPPESETAPKLVPVFDGLRKKYGDAVDMIDDPTGKNVDREKLCRVMAGLYGGILNLPKPESIKVLRWMFAP